MGDTDGVVLHGPAGVTDPLLAPSRLALFDLDRTLHPGSSLVDLGRAMVADGLVARRTLAVAALRHRRFRRRGASDRLVDTTRDKALAAVAGTERDRLLALAGAVADAVVAQVSGGARLLLARHLDAGDFCVVLSASPQELVEEVATRLGAQRGVGSRGEVVDGRFTGQLDGPFCYGPGKVARLRDALGDVELANAWAYADSGSDAPLLTACGHPVAVNPDRALRALARRNGWPVLHFG